MAEAKLKRTAALLKLIGTAILLISYVAQNFFYERSNARMIELSSAMRDRQLIDKGALLYELQYLFVANSGGLFDEPDRIALSASKARFAALKTAQSASVAINAAKALPEQETIGMLRGLYAEAAKVDDYRGLINLSNYVSQNVGSQAEQLNVQHERELSNRNLARIIVLTCYLLGATILIGGLVAEWRMARRAKDA